MECRLGHCLDHMKQGGLGGDLSAESARNSHVFVGLKDFRGLGLMSIVHGSFGVLRF